MRLTKIKLAGFKSFVDPTTVHLPSQLIGVVGPNGCGKSNIIDCVRWVMGESSAKHLRGENMTDVIFNGSAGRKPVSQASVELMFDNREGGIGGAYAAYNEISVKRVVNRDAQSAYYLNGTRCRRRDIMDVFLGTGLGPRSYAIIEQGMISRVVEAKPEELRIYLEEAAGISLYKERRKETEKRMRDTRENLDRLNDLRDEVGAQLDKAKRQAETAERYKVLKAEERTRRAELFALRLQALERELETVNRSLAERETAVEAEIARQRAAEAGIEEVRDAYSQDTDALNEIQGRFYGLGSDIARIEQQIGHQRELRDKQVKELGHAEEAVKDLEAALSQDREKLELLTERLEEIQPELEAIAEAESEAAELSATAQDALDGWQTRWDEFNHSAAEPVRVAQVERARIEQLERQSQELSRRQERLRSEGEAIALDRLEEEVEELAEQELEANEQLDELREQLSDSQDRLTELREQAEQLADELDEAKGEGQHLQARLTSLETLQQAALGNDDAGLKRWLDARGWGANDRLAQALDVEPGWERALETVLGDALQAVCVDELDSARVEDLEQGAVMLWTGAAAAGASGAADLLKAKVRAPWALDDLLAGIHCAENLAAARQLRASLAPGESVVTRDGLWLGRSWLRVRGAREASGGVLERGREMNELRERIEELGERRQRLNEQLEQAQDTVGDAEERRDELQEQLSELGRRHASVQAQLEGKRSRLQDLAERRERLAEEADELSRQVERGELETGEARSRLQQALDRSEALEDERERLLEEKQELQERLNGARERLRAERDRRHELQLKAESATTASRSLRESVERMSAQRARLTQRRDELQAALSAMQDPDSSLGEQREVLLAQRLEVEEQLTQARARLSEREHRLRELERERVEADRKVQELRLELESRRLKAQELKVRAQGEDGRLRELDLNYAEVITNLPAQASEDEWQRELERIESRVLRLGPINLAAIEEYQALEERKGYLDSQHADLMEALDTLEGAIRRIDRETRQRFKDTYDKVNAGVQRIFPRLFGGGRGYLELTGEDLLETGVAIMAQPPGKRITNIHLMSGGEKALTAVALVFAIFELNPSPFCMLDEVDAPLDEANVGRFGEMLVEMSPRVQFIFITHNKATMQIAQHLMGVTMHEPGVSRLVDVDVNEAVQLATA